ncbi:MAG: AI-2E family transporter [Actinomycetota bacterium]|nr:AI-2E family transporter [Actinomycetota bacterium]
MIKPRKNNNHETIKKIGIFSWSLIGLIIILAGIFYVLSLMKTAIIPGLIAIFIAYMLVPLVKLLRKKINKIWAVTITYVIFIGVVFVLFFFIIPVVYEEFRSVIIKLPFYIHRFSIFINNSIQRNTFLKNIENITGIRFLPSNSNEVTQFLIDKLNLGDFNIFKGATSLTRVIFNIVINFIIGPLLGFYILKDSEKFLTNLIRAIPDKSKHSAITVISRINNVFENYIRGQVIDAAIIAVLVTVGMIALKIEFSMLLGVTTFVFSLIPIIGPIIPIVPATISALLASPVKALIVIIIFIGIHLINYFFISPHIIKNRTGVHPALMLFSLIAGGSLFGWLGIFLAIPLVAVVQEIARYYLIDRKTNYLIR